jgi:NAD(P)-dependent dehydrogenase (short-subunit alcohol dehydrogenase family)
VKWKSALSASVTVGAIVLAVMSRRRVSLKGKIVLITGGSRGLGLATAKEFAAKEATVVICARDRQELERAKVQIDAIGGHSHIFVCDVSNVHQVNELVARVQQRVGPIDVLVNNAGIIKVGPFLNMVREDFEEALDVMFWGIVNTTLAVLPSMLERNQGSIINITSVGGKVSVPHLLPYCCAKFAAVGLSEGLRTELAAEGIRISTIVPGLMRTGSHLNAKFRGNHLAEYGWFAAGAASPFISIDAVRAAKSIVRAAQFGTGETVLSIPAKVLVSLQGMWPQMMAQILVFANSTLPNETRDNAVKTGKQIEPLLDSSVWRAFTKSGQSAAEQLNELS